MSDQRTIGHNATFEEAKIEYLYAKKLKKESTINALTFYWEGLMDGLVMVYPELKEVC